MGWYEIAKLVHFMGLIALFGFFVIFTRAGVQLRAASTLHDTRVWLGMLEGTRGMIPGAVGMFAVSGLTMTWLRWRGNYPFVAVGLATLLVIAAVWPFVGARHLRAMRAAVGEGDGPVPAHLSRVILDPTRWSVTGALNGASLGVLFVMTTKLGWVAAIAVVILLATVVGGITAIVVRRRQIAVGSESAGATT